MQSDYKELVKLTSWRTGVNEQIYKDLCNFLFAKTAEEMKKPKNLIIRLRGVGSWFLRMKRLKIKLHYTRSFIVLIGNNLLVWMEKKSQR